MENARRSREIDEEFFNQRYLRDIHLAKGNIFSSSREALLLAIAALITTVLTAQSGIAGPYSREP
jgi:hypothetical protein